MLCASSGCGASLRFSSSLPPCVLDRRSISHNKCVQALKGRSLVAVAPGTPQGNRPRAAGGMPIDIRAEACTSERLVYLDYNATTPIAPEVAAHMLPFLHSEFGNPSSSHALGRRAKEAIDVARDSVARLVDCWPDEVVFTSGGTESNNWAIAGAARALSHRGRHLVTSAVEHPAVAEVVHHLCEAEGFTSTVVPVDSEGRVEVDEVMQAIRGDTVLVTIMHSNNEVGSLQPVGELGRKLRALSILVHTDASQSIGKVPVSFRDLHVDLLTIAGHKLYAPKGVGALIVRRGTPLAKLMHGAGHEGGRRAGTESTLLVPGLGKACQLAHERLEEDMRHVRALRDRLREKLLSEFSGAGVHALVNGPKDPQLQLPNTLSLSIAGIEGSQLMAALTPDVACSSGSACHSGHISISPVLAAMKVPIEYAGTTLRLSTGRFTTIEEVDFAAATIGKVVRSLKVKVAAQELVA